MDTIIKALIFDDSVSVSVIKSTAIVNRAIDFFNLSPVCGAALGRTLTAAAFMATGLKGKKNSLTISINGQGPIGKIIVSADSGLNVRGYVSNPDINLPLNSKGKLDVSGAVGKNGKITVVKDSGLGEPYVGAADLVSGEIAEDFTKYFAVSEQSPTAVSLGVLIGKNCRCMSAGGLIFQPLPYCPENVIIKLENLINNYSDISKKLYRVSAEDFLRQNFGEYNLKFLEKKLPKYKCKCNLNKTKKVLSTLSKEEILDTLEKEGKIEVICHFCNKKYTFTKDNIKLA